MCHRTLGSLFFFNDTATTEIYTLSLHDALPISDRGGLAPGDQGCAGLVVHEVVAGDRGVRRADRLRVRRPRAAGGPVDRKSTRLNSSHANISYAVFCLKKKNLSHKQILYHV